jgi:hypothetical protein
LGCRGKPRYDSDEPRRRAEFALVVRHENGGRQRIMEAPDVLMTRWTGRRRGRPAPGARSLEVPGHGSPERKPSMGRWSRLTAEALGSLCQFVGMGIGMGVRWG